MRSTFMRAELARAEEQLIRVKALAIAMTGLCTAVRESRGYRAEYVAQLEQERRDALVAEMYADLLVKALRGETQGDHPGR